MVGVVVVVAAAVVGGGVVALALAALKEEEEEGGGGGMPVKADMKLENMLPSGCGGVGAGGEEAVVVVAVEAVVGDGTASPSGTRVVRMRCIDAE
jgi:hypothetical protein